MPACALHPQHGVLSQQFVELINKCNTLQSEYREKNVERIRRQLKISECAASPRGGRNGAPLSLGVPPTANAGMVSDEELEQMLDSGQSEVFVSNVSAVPFASALPVSVLWFPGRAPLMPRGYSGLGASGCTRCFSGALVVLGGDRTQPPV